MFELLETINARPKPFQYYTAEALWTDPYTSKMMLAYHLNESVDLSSRNKVFIDRSVQWIVPHFQIDTNTRIADFGCGPGLYTTKFAENNANVTGIDFSERSIQYASEMAVNQGLDINYVQANYLEYETEARFDLITMIFCDFCALSPTQRARLLAKMCAILRPGGSVLLDVHSLNTFNAIEEQSIYKRNLLDHFWSAEEYYCFLNTFKYDREKISLDKYTIIEASRTRVVYNWLQFFNQDSLRQEFEPSGFEVIDFYADVAGTPFASDSPDMAIVAKKV